MLIKMPEINPPVSKIMTDITKTVYLEIPGTRQDLLQAVRKYRYSTFPVCRANTKILEGIVSRNALVTNPEENQLSLLMSRDTITVSKDDTAKKVAELSIKHKIHRFPVVNDNNELLGIVSISDIVYKVLALSKINFQITSYYDRRVATVWENTPLNVALIILNLSRQNALPVLSSTGRLTGIVTLHDFLNVAEIISKNEQSVISSSGEDQSVSWETAQVIVIGENRLTLPNKSVKEIMITDVITAFIKSTVKDIAKKCRQHKIDQLPVVDAKDRLVGIISSWHLIKAYLDYLNELKPNN